MIDLIIRPNCAVLFVAAASRIPVLHPELELETELELEVDVEGELAMLVVGTGVVRMPRGMGYDILWCNQRYTSHHLDSGVGATVC